MLVDTKSSGIEHPTVCRHTAWLSPLEKDIEIVADGVTLVGAKLMRAIGLYRCSGVTLQGLTVDYDPLPFTQDDVIASAEDGNSIDVRIHAGYPRKPYARIDVVDRQTRFRKKGMPFLGGTKAEMIADLGSKKGSCSSLAIR